MCIRDRPWRSKPNFIFLEKYSSSIFVKLDKVKYEIIRVKIKTLKTLNLEKYNTLKSNYFFGSAFVTNP